MKKYAFPLFIVGCALIITGCSTPNENADGNETETSSAISSASGAEDAVLQGLLIARRKVGPYSDYQMLLMDYSGNEQDLIVLPKIPRYAHGKLYYFSTPTDLISYDILSRAQTTNHLDKAMSDLNVSKFIIHPDGTKIFSLYGPCTSDLEEGQDYSCDLFMHSLKSGTGVLLVSIERPGIWGLVDFAGVSEDGDLIVYNVRDEGKIGNAYYAYSLSQKKVLPLTAVLPDRFGYSKCKGKALAYTQEIDSYTSAYGSVTHGDEADALITCLP